MDLGILSTLVRRRHDGKASGLSDLSEEECGREEGWEGLYTMLVRERLC